MASSRPRASLRTRSPNSRSSGRHLGPTTRSSTGSTRRGATRLIEEVNEVLFLWVMASDQPGDPEQARRAAAVCERALLFAEPKGPWHALKARYDGRETRSRSVCLSPSAESERAGLL